MPDDTTDTSTDDLGGVPDHAIHQMAFESVAQRRDDGGVDCYVYLSGEIVWAYTGHTAEDFPAGLEDAAGWAGRAYAKRLAELIDDVDRTGATR